MLTVILLAAIGLIGLEVYEVWQNQRPLIEITGDLVPATAATGRALPEAREVPDVGIRTIVGRDLFDPDRGAKVEEPEEPEPVEEEPEPSIDGLLLLGTVIAGADRYAIMQVPPERSAVPTNVRRVRRRPVRQPVAQTAAEVRRVRVGDSLRGYQVKDIEEQRVVLARGESQTEVTIDYTREVAPTKPEVRTPDQKTRKRPVRSRRARRKPAR